MKIDFYCNEQDGEYRIETWTDHEMHLIPQIGDNVVLRDCDNHKDILCTVVSRIISRTLMKIYVTINADIDKN